MRSGVLSCIVLSLFLPTLAAAKNEESLRGSKASMRRQHNVAVKNDYSFTRTPAEVERFVKAGRLVALNGNSNYRVVGASFPYARPDVRTFVERLSAQYHAVCGEPLVVTSLTRPLSEQPHNAHALSVHPAGMAMDLRISTRTRCLRWVADTLLALEADGLLDVTREYNPPHLHIALFPAAYRAYLDGLQAKEAQEVAKEKALATLTSATFQLQAVLPLPGDRYNARAASDRPTSVLLAVALITSGLALVLFSSWRYRSARVAIRE